LKQVNVTQRVRGNSSPTRPKASHPVAAWESYRCAPIHTILKANFDENVVKFEQHISPYTVKKVGTRPARSWPLFIAMHGGGGAPKQVNDRQWKQMQVYYRDHPEVGRYLYLALRAAIRPTRPARNSRSRRIPTAAWWRNRLPNNKLSFSSLPRLDDSQYWHGYCGKNNRALI
jgi:hypothetical protein